MDRMDKNPLPCGESHGISTVTSFYLVALRETNVRSLNWRSVWWRWVAFQLHKTCTNVSPGLFAHVESPPYRRSFSNLTLHQSACSESAEGECNLAQANVWDVGRRGRASTLTFANIEVCFVWACSYQPPSSIHCGNSNRKNASIWCKAWHAGPVCAHQPFVWQPCNDTRVEMCCLRTRATRPSANFFWISGATNAILL